MSDVWHACANCGGRSPCEASDARDETIASLRAVVREYLAADANRVAMIAAWLSAEAGDDAANAALASAHARHAEAWRALVALDGGES